VTDDGNVATVGAGVVVGLEAGVGAETGTVGDEEAEVTTEEERAGVDLLIEDDEVEAAVKNDEDVENENKNLVLQQQQKSTKKTKVTNRVPNRFSCSLYFFFLLR